MEIYRKILEVYAGAAEKASIERLTIGLGYTAALLDNGRLGLSYTYVTDLESCMVFKYPGEIEGKPALPLLELIDSDNLVDRSVAIAVLNALNAEQAAACADDELEYLAAFAPGPGDKIAMAGYFGPVVEKIRGMGAELEIYDIGRGLGTEEAFYRLLKSGRAKGFILTATSLINGTTEKIFDRLHTNTPAVLLGPTTPMAPALFEHLPLDYIGGVAPVDTEHIEGAIRNGRGTRHILKGARKVSCRLG